MKILESLKTIQQELRASKDLFNAFGKYKYRSAESILESVKPLLNKLGCVILLSDELVNIGDRYYIKATATLRLADSNEEFPLVSTYGYAREEETKKGMDGSQITGASSSYARKYALGGLFALDDNKDSDTTNTHGKEPEAPKGAKYKEDVCAKSETIHKDGLEEMLIECNTIMEVIQIWWLLTKEQQKDSEIKGWFSARKSQLNDEGIYA